MKCEVKPADVANKPPRLVIADDGEIVLVRSENGMYFTGFIVATDKPSRLGCRSEKWVKSSFEDFHGEVTLSSS